MPPSHGLSTTFLLISMMRWVALVFWFLFEGVERIGVRFSVWVVDLIAPSTLAFPWRFPVTVWVIEFSDFFIAVWWWVPWRHQDAICWVDRSWIHTWFMLVFLPSLMILRNRHSTPSTTSPTLSAIEVPTIWKLVGSIGAGCISLFHLFWPARWDNPHLLFWII